MWLRECYSGCFSTVLLRFLFFLKKVSCGWHPFLLIKVLHSCRGVSGLRVASVRSGWGDDPICLWPLRREKEGVALLLLDYTAGGWRDAR